jgi:predicted N-acetyltransferase YhbS
MQSTIAPVVQVREATETDLESVISVISAANAQFERVLPPSFYRAYLANALDVRGRLEHARLLIAERDHRVVGTVTLYPDASQEGWGWQSSWTGIRAVAVTPAARGLGIGRQLTQECIDRSRTLGAAGVCLHTAAFMSAAVAMYESLGFRRRPEFDLTADAMFGSKRDEPRIAVLAYHLAL